jgi:hypothetical protein
MLMIALILFLAERVHAADDPRVSIQSWQSEGVLAALQDPSDRVRPGALAWLSQRHATGEPLARRVAGYLSHDVPRNVRLSAIQALGGMGSDAGVVAPQIGELLKDSDIRNDVATTLGQMGGAAAPVVAQVANLLDDPDPSVRAAAVV